MSDEERLARRMGTATQTFSAVACGSSELETATPTPWGMVVGPPVQREQHGLTSVALGPGVLDVLVAGPPGPDLSLWLRERVGHVTPMGSVWRRGFARLVAPPGWALVTCAAHAPDQPVTALFQAASLVLDLADDEDAWRVTADDAPLFAQVGRGRVRWGQAFPTGVVPPVSAVVADWLVVRLQAPVLAQALP